MTVLDKKELFTPSPIQDMSFMELKRSKNINNFVLIAPTGTGKTLAYLLPMMDTLKRDEDDASIATYDETKS
jgi:superfamily II DNA/RNA helicase